MIKSIYEKPETEIYHVNVETLMGPIATAQVDDGNGNKTDNVVTTDPPTNPNPGGGLNDGLDDTWGD